MRQGRSVERDKDCKYGKSAHVERDARIEEKLKGKLKTLLNDKFLTRSECETYLRFEADKQDEIANRFEKLQAVDCHSDDTESAGKNYVEVLE